LAVDDHREELERDVVRRREPEIDPPQEVRVGADEADGVPGAEVRPHGITGQRDRIRELLARARAAWPAARHVGALRDVMPDARVRLVEDLAARLARAIAPVDLLVVREVRLVEEAD